MDTYNHNTQMYIDRMNQTALSKFDCLQPYLCDGVSVLDFGSGYSPEFIREVESTGAIYTAYDASPVVLEKLHADGVNAIADVTEKYDVIFLSSVFHELISYLSDVEYNRTTKMIADAVKPGGHIIIRDWANPGRSNRCHIVIQPDKLEEVKLWVHALCYNEIVERPTFYHNILTTSEYDMYQIMYHTVWGTDSIGREARETYDVTSRVHDFGKEHHLQLVHFEEQYDQTYLPHLQKYFDVPAIPFATKGIWVFQKMREQKKMEHYLQQLDKINQYLDFTDVNAFPIWRFVGSHLGVVIGLMALATFGHIIAEEMGYRWLEILAGITGIVLVVGIFGALVELATPPHDRAGVTKDSYAQAMNYVADMPEDEFLQLYADTEKYEFTQEQYKQYHSSSRIVYDYYMKQYKK